MYFTLAISAASREACAVLLGAASSTDPRVMPIPGPPAVAWLAPDGLAALVCWGAPALAEPAAPAVAEPAVPVLAEPAVPASHAGTIRADAGGVHARTGAARIDPVYVAEVPGAVVVSDRAAWAAAVTGRLREPDPVMIGAFLAVGYPVGAATPFRGVRALGCGQRLTVTGDRLVVTAEPSGPWAAGADPRGAVAAALAAAVSDAGGPVELSLTGGKDSRLIAAALTAAGVPFRARTHGFATHPDVVVAAMIAGRLGVEHVITEPKPPGAGPARGAGPGGGAGAARGDSQVPGEAAVLGRLRSAALVSDGMLSAYENIGTPDPRFAVEPVQAGGHGGELLRGGYAAAAWSSRSPARAWSEARGTELFRRMTTRRMGLLRPAAAGEYLASLTRYAAALPRGPLRTLDDFYLANRAGRWSATARQAYLMRSPLLQPFFADAVIRAARAVPLPDRITDRLHREVLAALCPDLLELPLAGSGWKSGPRNALAAAAAPVPAAGPGSAAGPVSVAARDWRRHYGEETARLLRDYTLDQGDAGQMFGIVRRQAAERVLRPPHADPDAVWALATLAALLSGDWLNAREPEGQESVPSSGRVSG